jgi:hypothetical protein
MSATPYEAPPVAVMVPLLMIMVLAALKGLYLMKNVTPITLKTPEGGGPNGVNDERETGRNEGI